MNRTLVLLVAGLGVFLSLGAAPATAVDDRFVYSGNQAAGGWFTVDVLANDTVPGDQVRAVELVFEPTDGEVEATTRPVGFRWRAGSSLTARWSYRIVDEAGTPSNTATVSVGVRPGPLPRDDGYEATSGVLLKVPAPGVLAGDTHPAGDPLRAETGVTNGVTARGGRIVLREDGSFDYAPPPGFTGTDSFAYRAVDPQDDAAEATVTIAVLPRPAEHPPTHAPAGDQPSGKPEVTTHLHGYPAACRSGVLLIGGTKLDTWLDEARQGPGSAGWDFIDLHAFIPDGLPAGVRTVEFRCAGTTHPAGTMTLPTGPGLTTFELTWKPTATTTTPGPPGDPGDPDDSGYSGGPVDPPVPRGPGFPDIPVPGEVPLDPLSLVVSAADTAAILAIVLLLETAFPADLVNKVIEVLRTPRAQDRLLKAIPRTPGWIRALGYAAVGGALLVWADAAINARTWDWGIVLPKAAVGATALLLVVTAYEKPKDALLSASRGRGHLRAMWLGFLLAAALATLSRFLVLPVPYVYGLVITFIAVGTADRHLQGRATLGGGITVLLTCAGLWVALAPLVVEGRTADPKSLAYGIALAISVVLAAGIQLVVFGLVPVTPLDGHALKAWNKLAWWLLYAPAVLFYVHVVLRSVHPAVEEDPAGEKIFLASCLFVVAGGVSLFLRRLKPVSGRG
ncbi:FGLLP motif-containing membrane protein [Amycolatopsis magusensis]|uniref:FGLLP motif-containing membrane protein n=1 Tax=Amycolatopsis magusensis TaxID=882444 RepID=UPI003C302753